MTDVGVTIGVEEEYHLVHDGSWGLADAPEVVDAARELLGESAQGEISTSQLEVATPICSSLSEVREQLVRLRSGADAAARASGCRLLPSATHPTCTWRDQRLTDDERYVEIADRFGLLALQQLITGTHVHVGIPDPELVVPVLDRLRPDLAVLLAMSTSSPFWEGVDTGLASYRTHHFARFPVTGPPEPQVTREAYDARVAELVATGMISDASNLYWDARPSNRFPTLEVRIADTMPLLDDVVLHDALVRALVRTAAAEALAGEPVPELGAELARAARWRAARYGLSDALLDVRARALRPAAEVVGALVERVRPALEEVGDVEEVEELTKALLARGTSADRQRAVAAAHGVGAVVPAVCAELGVGG